MLDVIYLISVQNGYFHDFSEILAAPAISNGCGLPYIAKELKEHFRSNKKFNKIPIRIIRAQAIQLSRYSYRLLDVMMGKNENNPSLTITLLALAKICETLGKIGSLMNPVEIDNAMVMELTENCGLYFNLFSLFFKHACNSTVWTLGYVVPYHARLLYDRYKIGYGILSMQGKESKHSAIKQEL